MMNYKILLIYLKKIIYIIINNIRNNYFINVKKIFYNIN